MDDWLHAFGFAVGLIGRFDAELREVVLMSLRVSLTAAIIAFLIGAPVGGLLAIVRFYGKTGFLIGLNSLLGLPPVVIGLGVYLLASRSGPLGPLGLLFTPYAMILAQTLLALPIVVALVHRTADGLWAEFGDTLRMDGARLVRAVQTLLAMAGAGLLTAFLAAFGRAIAEVGAIVMVGGNIRGVTRTMTTAIVLETNRGDLALALALGLILLTLTLLVSGLAFGVSRLASAR
jgi:tungstate transport system permease protein